MARPIYIRMRFKKWVLREVFRGYGGPKFDWKQYEDDYAGGRYLNYKQLYDDVQMELYNLNGEIKRAWKVDYTDLVWFEDSLRPDQYTSGMTVQSTWAEDHQHGVNNFQSLVEYLTELEGEPFAPEDLAGLDPAKMESMKRLLWDFDFENLGPDDWDVNWGPYRWQPESGEWERCRRIALEHERYPVNVLVNGTMIDGAHRLAVAVFQRQGSYPCLVGCPSHWFT